MPARNLGNVTGQLVIADSPLRLYLDSYFPHRKEVFGLYRTKASALLVPSTVSSIAASVGGTFDVLLREELAPGSFPPIANWVASRLPDGYPAFADLLILLADHLSALRQGIWDEGAARAAWALNEFIVQWRTGLRFLDRSAICALITEHERRVSPFLALAPQAGIDQLEALWRVARSALIPHLPAQRSINVTFETSCWCGADVDLLAGDLLVDFKVAAGRTTHAGVVDAVGLAEVYQLLAYALFDRFDEHQIRRVGIYSARFGHLWTIGLQDLADRLAGRPVDLQAERERTWDVMEAAATGG